MKLLLPLFGILLLVSCQKNQIQLSPEQQIVGNWKLIKATYKAGIWKPNKDVTNDYQNLELQFSSNASINYTHNVNQKTGSWKWYEYTVNVSVDENTPINTPIQELIIQWSNASKTETWAVASITNENLIVSLAKDGGTLSYYLTKQ